MRTEKTIADIMKLVRIDPITGCWLYLGYKHNGYAWMRFRGKSRVGHRVTSYLLKGTPLEGNFDLMHSCDNRGCINPDHTSQGTRLENMQDAMKKGRLRRVPRMECKYGHVLIDDNVYVTPDGRRQCKTCTQYRSKKHESRTANVSNRST